MHCPLFVVVWPPDDVHLTQHELTVPSNRTIIIDVLLKPVDANGTVLKQFPKGSFWVSHFGLGISQYVNDDDDDHDFVGIRTTVQKEEGEYVLQRQFLKEWLDFTDWLSADVSSSVRAKQIEPLAVQLVDAKRDLSEELHRQGSFWDRLTSDLNLEAADIASIEKQLETIKTNIVSKSEVLGFVKAECVKRLCPNFCRSKHLTRYAWGRLSTRLLADV